MHSPPEAGHGLDERRRILLPAEEGGALAGLLRRRASTKSYRAEGLDTATLGGLLETAAGTGRDGRRPYGSAHARYDVELTVAAAEVDGLPPAAYRYLAGEHALLLVKEDDHRGSLADATLDAGWLASCPVVLLLSADTAAADAAFTAQGPGRGERFCWLEAGLLAQNVHLWAAEHGLGTVFVGGLDPAKTRTATKGLVPPSHTVLGLLPLGRPAVEGAAS